MSKNIKSHPDYQSYLSQWSALYENKNYDSGLTGFFLKKSHKLAEIAFSEKDHFTRVLEVGAGSGIHLNYVRHSFDEYLMTDLNEIFIENTLLPKSTHVQGKIAFAKEDATSLSFEDNTFDRIIAAHVLEHLYYPHEVLQEWGRLLKPGGVLTLVLPCDPGCLWRLGRYAVARKKIIKANLEYDYWMAREHVNPINNLISFIRHYFSNVTEKWFPLGLPSIDLNLFYIAHIKV